MKVFCIISDERAYRSRSPVIFNRILKRTGIKGAYVPFQVSPDEIGFAIQSLKVLNIAGANITAPRRLRKYSTGQERPRPLLSSSSTLM